MLNYQIVSEVMTKIRNEPDYPGYGFVYAEFFWAQKISSVVHVVSKKIFDQDELNKVTDEIGKEPELALIKAGQYGKQTRAVGFNHQGDKKFDYENRRLKCSLGCETPDRIRGDVSNIQVFARENADKNISTGRKLFLELRMRDGDYIDVVR